MLVVRHAADRIQPRSKEKIPMMERNLSYIGGNGTFVISANWPIISRTSGACKKAMKDGGEVFNLPSLSREHPHDKYAEMLVIRDVRLEM